MFELQLQWFSRGFLLLSLWSEVWRTWNIVGDWKRMTVKQEKRKKRLLSFSKQPWHLKGNNEEVRNWWKNSWGNLSRWAEGRKQGADHKNATELRWRGPLSKSCYRHSKEFSSQTRYVKTRTINPADVESGNRWIEKSCCKSAET